MAKAELKQDATEAAIAALAMPKGGVTNTGATPAPIR